MKKALTILGVALVFSACIALTRSHVSAHCQIPCGIYDDPARFTLLSEHITTIEKSMKQIVELSGAEKKNHNQIVRWVKNKEHHADALIDIVSHYFLAQRVKPVGDGDAAAHKRYTAKLQALHGLIVSAMKAKQTTDLAHVKALREHLATFKGLYERK